MTTDELEQLGTRCLLALAQAYAEARAAGRISDEGEAPFNLELEAIVGEPSGDTEHELERLQTTLVGNAAVADALAALHAAGATLRFEDDPYGSARARIYVDTT